MSEDRRRPILSSSISRTNSDWVRDLAKEYNTPISRVLDAFISSFREVYEGTAAATSDPRLERAFRAKETLRAASSGEDVPGIDVLHLLQTVLEEVAP